MTNFCVKAIVVAVVCSAAGGMGLAAEPPDAAKTPILMELFTSEGCSSCPPVDGWVERLDRVQPVAGAQLIVLSEHVDYWDHDGWKDPYSSAALTERQSEYERALGESSAFTPQVIVNGDEEVRPWKPDEAKSVLEKAARGAAVTVQIEGAAVAGGSVTGRIDADANGDRHGDVLIAVALDRTMTDVLGGENNGKKLTNVAVVESLVKVGKLEKGKGFHGTFAVKLGPGADAGNLRVVAFVQEPGPGRVLGAAMTKEIGKSGS